MTARLQEPGLPVYAPCSLQALQSAIKEPRKCSWLSNREPLSSSDSGRLADPWLEACGALEQSEALGGVLKLYRGSDFRDVKLITRVNVSELPGGRAGPSETAVESLNRLLRSPRPGTSPAPARSDHRVRAGGCPAAPRGDPWVTGSHPSQASSRFIPKGPQHLRSA